MPKSSKILIGTGLVLAPAAVAAATAISFMEPAVSPCFDNYASRMMCTADPPHMADRQDDEPEPSRVQRSPIVTASSTVVQLSARSMVMAAGRGALALSSA
jgi:hypothetical protein